MAKINDTKNMNGSIPFLTPEKVLEIRKVASAFPYEGNEWLANIFGCSKTTIHNALSDKFDEHGLPAKECGAAAASRDYGSTQQIVEAIEAVADETTLENLYASLQATNHLVYEIAEMLRRCLELPGYKASDGRGQSLASKLQEEYIK